MHRSNLDSPWIFPGKKLRDVQQEREGTSLTLIGETNICKRDQDRDWRPYESSKRDRDFSHFGLASKTETEFYWTLVS